MVSCIYFTILPIYLCTLRSEGNTNIIIIIIISKYTITFFYTFLQKNDNTNTVSGKYGSHPERCVWPGRDGLRTARGQWSQRLWEECRLSYAERRRGCVVGKWTPPRMMSALTFWVILYLHRYITIPEDNEAYELWCEGACDFCRIFIVSERCRGFFLKAFVLHGCHVYILLSLLLTVTRDRAWSPFLRQSWCTNSRSAICCWVIWLSSDHISVFSLRSVLSWRLDPLLSTCCGPSWRYVYSYAMPTQCELFHVRSWHRTLSLPFGL